MMIERLVRMRAAVPSVARQIRGAMPSWLKSYYRLALLKYNRRRNRSRTAAEVFSSIYADNTWGGGRGEFCSGSGSTAEQAALYAEAMLAFMQREGVSSVVDLGCGDFEVGSRLVGQGASYAGVDVVPSLIARNTERFATDGVSFVCADITTDDLPEGELCLVRQVLQHLSNEEIGRILTRLEKYHYVIISEHYPPEGLRVVPNVDKVHGPDTRIVDGSAVYLTEAPFSRTVAETILSVDVLTPIKYPGERIVSFLLVN